MNKLSKIKYKKKKAAQDYIDSAVAILNCMGESNSRAGLDALIKASAIIEERFGKKKEVRN